ncbi:curlin repeat-containing protein [Bradyrhizobium sp. DASA03120]|uniref:curlin repeat-containing protein n=1 Tax=Bradyrhizobium sp. SMVTL-02 TaxID=3395917 RepID=UPI003F729591
MLRAGRQRYVGDCTTVRNEQQLEPAPARDGNFAGTSQHGRSNSAGAMQVGDGNRVRVHQW